jgi:two-component system chemotaxis response regulator CheY
MSKTCLVVDDSRVVRKVARRILEDLNLTVEEAADGKLALEACQRQMPDAVLLDWDMPVMNGVEFLKLLRAAPGGNEPLVVFCTSHAELDHIQQAINAGANEYIMKPFDGDILEAKMIQVGLL